MHGWQIDCGGLGLADKAISLSAGLQCLFSVFFIDPARQYVEPDSITPVLSEK